MAAGSPEAGGGETVDYTVKRGDTLMKIAFETTGDLFQWRKIYEMNREAIPDPGQLKRGTVLKIEKPAGDVAIDRNGEAYQIVSGDTLGRISNKVYGTPTKWKSIYENNRQLIKDPNKIFAGFTLYYLPADGGGQPEMKPEPLAQQQTQPADARTPAAAPQAAGQAPVAPAGT